MLIDSIAKALKRSGCLDGFWGKLDEPEDATLGVASSARPMLVAARFAIHPQTTLCVISGEDAAISLARNLRAYLGDESVLHFPERVDVPGSGKPADAKTMALRAEAAWALASVKEALVVASAQSLIRALPPVSAEAFKPVRLRIGDDLADGSVDGVDDLSGLAKLLQSMGYENTGELEGRGTFALHGGTLDVFAGNMAYPVRLDFFGDEVEEIRRIIPTTGQTISSVEKISIYPVTDVPLDAATETKARKALEKPALTDKRSRELLNLLDSRLNREVASALLPYVHGKLSTLGDHLGKRDMCALMEPRSLMDNMANSKADADEKMSSSALPLGALLMEPAAVSMGDCTRATYVSIMQVGSAADDDLPVKRPDVSGNEERLFGKMRNWMEARYLCIFSVPDARARKSMELEFVDRSLPIHAVSDDEDDEPLKRGVVNITEADIPLGLIIPKAKLALVSIDDMRRMNSEARQRRAVDITEITFPYAPGDYVVHSTYGIALFKDIIRRDMDGVERDYIELDYAEGDKLFLPIDQFDKVTRYVGPEDVKPKITRLDSSDWSRAMKRARAATRKLAFDLVDVYARRAQAKGRSFNVRTPWMQQMEESFPYQETPDQLTAIQDVFADMESTKPMDRLICGDVGFGKTEVAIRAAFAAAQDKRQVMVLCPTTILAQQHYMSFKERMEPFGLRVDVLSRFRTPKEQEASLEAFARGEVDVLVGTHRLLSRDVNPKDLGLVIIDEEQRFGVGHKEQFKNLRESVDVLTLSATPIPRTMQMATSGVRDMSLILTPPDDRLPVKVHVGEWDPDVVSAAIRYELARKGQVYYVSNRVRTIDDALARVASAAPEARVGVAHGKMTKDELERVMEDFAAGNIDVMVATTIIESGIDNPHTNTLIIEDSQRLGLSQMYQLKGRVGRSSTQAYAYFMFPEDAYLTEDAHARLEALADNQDLGSGMRIALKDLEIRGAGDILGAEQSGNMSQVGFDLFSQMLQRAVMEMRESPDGKALLERDMSDVTVSIEGRAYLSEEYVPDISERVIWYRRIACAYDVDEVDALEQDLAREHPGMPEEAKNLFSKARLRAYAARKGASNISVSAGKLNIEGIALDREQRIALKRSGGRYLPEKRKTIVPMSRVRKADDETSDPASDIFGYMRGFLEGEVPDGE